MNTLRINGSNEVSSTDVVCAGGNGVCCPIGSVTSRNLTYECRDIQAVHSGIYSGHVGFTCGSINPEWCSLNVTVTVTNHCNGMQCISCAIVLFVVYIHKLYIQILFVTQSKKTDLITYLKY